MGHVGRTRQVSFLETKTGEHIRAELIRKKFGQCGHTRGGRARKQSQQFSIRAHGRGLSNGRQASRTRPNRRMLLVRPLPRLWYGLCKEKFHKAIHRRIRLELLRRVKILDASDATQASVITGEARVTAHEKNRESHLRDPRLVSTSLGMRRWSRFEKGGDRGVLGTPHK